MISNANPKRSVLSLLLCVAFGPVALTAAEEVTTYGTLNRVSTSISDTPATGSSGVPRVSADGRFIAFFSDADNLVFGDFNGARDIFLRDRLTGLTHVISTAASGEQGNASSSFPGISDDGRFVAFESLADNLIDSDHNGLRDIYVKDLATGSVERISISTDGAEANGPSYQPSLSASGRYVIFQSTATNLVADDTNGVADVFVHDRVLKTTVRASVATGGGEAHGPSSGGRITSDGRFVVFDSQASDLIALDGNGVQDVFLHDLDLGTTVRLSQSADGTPADKPSYFGRISADGETAAFASAATNLVAGDTDSHTEIVLVDLATGARSRADQSSAGDLPDASASFPEISADGRYVTYTTEASNLVPEDNNGREDVFVYDRLQSKTLRVSLSNQGVQIDGFSSYPAVSANGKVIAFMSDATNLVENDDNNWVDVYVADLTNGDPPPAIPFETVSLDITRARAVNSPKTGRDAFTVVAGYQFLPVSIDGVFNPGSENFEIRMGDAEKPFVVTIPAGDTGWKQTKAGKWTYTSPKTAVGKLNIRLDPVKKNIQVRAQRFDFPVAPTAQMFLRIQIGNDLVISQKTWKTNKALSAFWLP